MAVAALFGVGSANAQAKPWEWPPDQPVVGDPSGVDGPGPKLAIGRRAWLMGARTVWIGVYCDSSTDMDCRGHLEVSGPYGANVETAHLELYDEQVTNVAIELSRPGVRSARRSGLRLMGTATVTDNLGRTATDTAGIKVGRRKR